MQSRFCKNCGTWLTLSTKESTRYPKAAISSKNIKTSGATHELCGLQFQFVCEIKPELDNSGMPIECMPQSRYRNMSNIRLHKYGKGPFCLFKIPNDYRRAGIYIVLIGKLPKYVGECEDLTKRWNVGYGNISPRNCYVGGQETNCRINNLILEAFREGSEIILLFHEMDDDRKINEASLREKLQPDWNRQ